jgi:hypothetical protein
MVWVARPFDMNDEAIESFADLQSKFHSSQFSAACGIATACETGFLSNFRGLFVFFVPRA